MAFQVLVKKQRALFLPPFPSSTFKKAACCRALGSCSPRTADSSHLWIWLKATRGKADRETVSVCSWVASFTSKEGECERGQRAKLLASKVEHLHLLLQMEYPSAALVPCIVTYCNFEVKDCSFTVMRVISQPEQAENWNWESKSLLLQTAVSVCMWG